MSSKPLGKQLPHQATAYIAKPITTSNTKQLVFVEKFYQMFICICPLVMTILLSVMRTPLLVDLQ